MNLIEIKDLQKIYRSGAQTTPALNGIDLDIGAGMFGLLGPNGAGKTTLMRILAGIVQPTRGTVRVCGRTMDSEQERLAVKAMLGYLPQELGLYPELSARQFIDYMAILKGMDDPASRRRRVDEVISLVGLEQAADRKLKGFSGGMKRRAGIAQALVNDPQLLIVDEPTAGLDPEERIRFRNLLVRLAGERVVLLSTHIVEDIGQTSRDIAVLSKGKLLFRGSPAELIHAAQGHVWSVVSHDLEKPDHGLTVVSMLHLAEGVQYRLVGEAAPPIPGVEPASPGLEDAYVWLMRRSGHTLEN